jgi:hypothetical protein
MPDLTQKALIVRTGPEGPDGLDALNTALNKGWRVAQVAPMGGAGGGQTTDFSHAALVILELGRAAEEALLAAEEAIEEPDEVVEEVVEELAEGDGAPPTAPGVADPDATDPGAPPRRRPNAPTDAALAELLARSREG